MKIFRVAVLPGDGIGPEVTAEAERVLRAAAEHFGFGLALLRYPIGGVGVELFGTPLPDVTRAAVMGADAVLLGAVGGPTFDAGPRHLRPETGLLDLRVLLGVFANLRPVSIYPALAGRSPLRADRLRGVHLLIIRELTGGLYYGEPRGNTGTVAVNTLRYNADEIERVARVGFVAARGRRNRLLSVDKANVLETSQLWRATVSRIAAEYPEVMLEHGYVDSVAMRLVADPASIDVLLTENLFGDILSDEAAVLAGSLGMLPSASLGNGIGLFEPIHGSAPALAGRNSANPIGAIASAALLLRHGLKLEGAATAVEAAIRVVIENGARTADIAGPSEAVIGTQEMGERITTALLAAPTTRPDVPVAVGSA